MKYLYILFTVLILLISCKEKMECNAFPTNEKDWFPYLKNDKIVLKNNHDSIICTITQVNSTDNYINDKQCDCNCMSEMHLYTTIDSLNLISFEVLFHYENNEDSIIPPPISLLIHHYEMNLAQQKLLISNTESLYERTFKDSLLIGNKMYKKIVIIENTEKIIGYKSAKFVKGVGLIEIIDRNDKSWIFPN